MSLNVLPANSSRFIPQSAWINVIGPEVMRQCDALDGVRTLANLCETSGGKANSYNHQLSDGIINDPRACRYALEAHLRITNSKPTIHFFSFRPEALTCTLGQNTSTCLTVDQIGALHRIYADYYEADQTYIFGGYQPGGEKAFATGLVGNPPFPLPQDWFRFLLLK